MSMIPQQTLRTVADLAIRQLRTTHGVDLKILKNGVPDRVSRPENGIDHDRVRLVPDMRPRRPRGFWDSIWCFYEVGIGHYPQPGLAKVQFFMAGNNNRCGGGFHNAGVDAILSAAAKKRADLNHHSILRQGTYAWLDLYHAMPDTATMARDLVWIVTETLPAFLSLPDAPGQ